MHLPHHRKSDISEATILSSAGPEDSLSPPPSPLEQPQQPSQTKAGTSRDSVWRNVDPSGWEIPDTPFKRVHDELTELQTQFDCLEHITRGARQALGGCGPENIIREIAKRADRKELEQAKRELNQARLENAHLQAQMTSMADKLVQKSEEIRKYHAEQTVIFGRIRELVGHPGKIANKARLYNQLVESGDPVFAQQTIPILVTCVTLQSGLDQSGLVVREDPDTI